MDAWKDAGLKTVKAPEPKASILPSKKPVQGGDTR